MTVTVWTEGGTDTFGHLRESDGQVITSDSRSGEGNNFRIEHDVGPGIYYVDVRGNGGATGDYVIAATALRHLSLPSRIAGEIRSSGESVWHPLTVDSPGIVTIWTEGGTNTWGRLRDANGDLIAIDDDGGEGRNFASGFCFQPVLISSTFKAVSEPPAHTHWRPSGQTCVSRPALWRTGLRCHSSLWRPALLQADSGYAVERNDPVRGRYRR